MKCAARGRSGFTLVEMLISSGITVALLTVLFSSVDRTERLSSTALVHGRLADWASAAAQRVRDDLRWADEGSLMITEENGSARLDLVVARGHNGIDILWSTPVSWSWTPSPLDADGDGLPDEGTLVRVQDGRTRVVCRGVDRGGFQAVRTDDSVEIAVRLVGRASDGRRVEADAGCTATIVNGGTP